MVELEYLLNEHLDDISTNLHLLEGSKKTIQKDAYTYNQFHELRLVSDLELRLADLKIINKTFKYKSSIVRLNRDMASLNRANEKLITIALAEASQANIQKNRQHLVDQLDNLERFAKKYEKETRELLCFIRVYLRVNKNWFTKSAHKFKNLKGTVIDDDLLKTETEVLKGEISSNQE